jgi:hypothetical protein
MKTAPPEQRDRPLLNWTEEQVQAMGYPFVRQLDDGRWLGVAPMTYGKGRLFVDLDRCGFTACYCYSSVALAIVAMATFNPEQEDEPDGWFKDPMRGRHRPDGDKTREYSERG